MSSVGITLKVKGLTIVVQQRTYHALGIEVQPLTISERELNTKRMLDLMAVSHSEGPVPLYLHTVYRILRDMRMVEQETGTGFCYAKFKQQVKDAPMSPGQLGPLTQRLDTLESFMPRAEMHVFGKKKNRIVVNRGNQWRNEVRISPSTFSWFKIDIFRLVASLL